MSGLVGQRPGVTEWVGIRVKVRTGMRRVMGKRGREHALGMRKYMEVVRKMWGEEQMAGV